MFTRTPISTRTDTMFPSPALFRARLPCAGGGAGNRRQLKKREGLDSGFVVWVASLGLWFVGRAGRYLFNAGDDGHCGGSSGGPRRPTPCSPGRDSYRRIASCGLAVVCCLAGPRLPTRLFPKMGRALWGERSV